MKNRLDYGASFATFLTNQAQQIIGSSIPRSIGLRLRWYCKRKLRLSFLCEFVIHITQIPQRCSWNFGKLSWRRKSDTCELKSFQVSNGKKVTSNLIGDHILNTNVQDQKSILLHCGEKLKRRLKKKDLTLYKESIKLGYSFILVYKGFVHRHSFLCLKSLTISTNANVNPIERAKVCETAQYSQPFRAHLIVPACTSLSYVQAYSGEASR